MKLFVSGASGNVGRCLIREIWRREMLAGGWCAERDVDFGQMAGMEPLGLSSSGNLERDLDEAGPDVVIDFTSASVVEKNVDIYLERKLDVVMGTTGFSRELMGRMRERVLESGLRWCVIANYGIGVSYVEEFIRKIRPHYPYVSIIDRHPARMANAPSGTAAHMAHVASEGPQGKVSSREVYRGVMGAEIDGVQVMSQRMPYPGPYSEHEVTLARQDEVIRITVQSHTSEIYVDGVLRCAELMFTRPAGSFVTSMVELGAV